MNSKLLTQEHWSPTVKISSEDLNILSLLLMEFSAPEIKTE